VAVKGEPAIVIEPVPGFWPEGERGKRDIITKVREVALRSPLSNAIKKFYVNPSLPVDRRHNAKVYRDRLGKWAEREDRRNYKLKGVANG
jgi:hypothetical protein